MADKAYIERVTAYGKYLEENADRAIPTLVELFNKKGIDYFGEAQYQPMVSIEDILSNFKLEIYNKSQFIEKAKEERGVDELEEDEAAFDDAYRHTIFIDVSDMENPQLVKEPSGLLKDYVLTWESVQELPHLLVDGKTIALHEDSLSYIFFPIPTVSSGGRRKRVRRIKKTKTRKIRKVKLTTRQS